MFIYIYILSYKLPIKLFFTNKDKLNRNGRNKSWLVGLWCLMPLSVILWRSDLLVEETGGPGENPQPVASH